MELKKQSKKWCKMIVKIHRNERGAIILAVCDKLLIGQVFTEGEKQLTVDADFYGGEEVNEDEAGDLMRNANIVNIIGQKAIALALREEIIDSENIKKIAGIPYSQVSLSYDYI